MSDESTGHAEQNAHLEQDRDEQSLYHVCDQAPMQDQALRLGTVDTISSQTFSLCIFGPGRRKRASEGQKSIEERSNELYGCRNTRSPTTQGGF